MEWHFGYNCIHYLPTMNRCRILIDEYRMRDDLVTTKWMTSKDTLLYLNKSHEEIIKLINSGSIKVKVKKDMSLLFEVSGAWQYDDCGLGNTGGHCFYFMPHIGTKISCIMDIKRLCVEHPNLANIPSDEIINEFENQVISSINLDDLLSYSK